jgi:hypothetical protein
MTGESMLPTIVDGQRVAIKLGRRRLERGDLILFRLADEWVVHRLLGETVSPEGQPCLRTRGDGRQFFDPPIYHEMVEGRVIALQKARGWCDLRSAGAKIYSLSLVLHGFCWTMISLLARRVEAALRGVGIAWPMQSWVGRLDAGLLRLVHRLLFTRLHRHSTLPPESGCYTADLPG